MGLTLPPLLERLLNDLGFTWPEVDETELAALAGTWLSLGAAFGQAAQTANGATAQLAAQNSGAAMDAFLASWAKDRAPAATLERAAVGVDAGAAAIYVAAAITLALKVNTIVNLTILAVEISQAVATAPVTFGASLAEIPVFKEVTSRFIQLVVNEAVTAIMA